MFEARLATFRDDQVHGFRTDKLDVGAGCIKVSVVGDNVCFLAGDTEEDALGSAALVRGNDVLVANDILDRVAEMVETAAPSIAFIAFHDGSPLVGGHSSRAGVREEVDQDVIGGQEEEIVVGGAQQLCAWSSEWTRSS